MTERVGFASALTVAAACMALLFSLSVRADEALVSAAREAKAKRKTTSSRVITNADVKKSKGKLVTNGAASKGSKDAAPSQTLTEKAAKERQARRDYEEKHRQLVADVESLEKQVAQLEQSYYDENDLSRRDVVITAQFNEAKGKLDAARAALEQLENAQRATESANVKIENKDR